MDLEGSDESMEGRNTCYKHLGWSTQHWMIGESFRVKTLDRVRTSIVMVCCS